MADQNFDNEQAVHTVPEEEAEISADAGDVDEQSIETDDEIAAEEMESSSDDGVHGLEHESELEKVPQNGEQSAGLLDQTTHQPAGPPKSWYIIHAYSGFEQKVAESLRSRAQAFGFAGRLGQILIPTEEVIELRGGKKVISKRLLYPGYVLVEMEMDDELWHAVKSTPRVTGFVGGGTKPVPLTADEVNSVLYRQAASTDRPRPKMSFEKNETVKIVDGPFTNFSGKVDEVNTERNTLRVMVTIFGRSTPVELDFLQVEKI
jgi:transcription termination/antitermination protein NusG